MNISKFLSPDPFFFVSPFLGILSAFVTQLFLLRRIVRFITSLELLWPFLSRKIVKYSFMAGMVLAIMVVAIEGSIASAMVMKSGGLASLGLGAGKDPIEWVNTLTLAVRYDPGSTIADSAGFRSVQLYGSGEP